MATVAPDEAGRSLFPEAGRYLVKVLRGECPRLLRVLHGASATLCDRGSLSGSRHPERSAPSRHHGEGSRLGRWRFFTPLRSVQNDMAAGVLEGQELSRPCQWVAGEVGQS